MKLSEKRKKYLREWRKNNLERERKRQRKWQEKWRKKNPEKAREQDKIKREKYKERRKSYNSEYYKKRIKEDPRFKMRHIYSSAISARLRKRFSGKNCKSSFDYLPYTIDDLMKRLEEQFKDGMSWKNYGKWHIDHITPDSHFRYKNPEDEEFRKCWSLDNLQPLWAKENIRKSNKLPQALDDLKPIISNILK